MSESRFQLWKMGQDLWTELRGKHIFVTGGTGFFGRTLLELVHLYNTQYGLDLRLTVLTRSSEAFRKSWPELTASKSLNFIVGDVTSFNFPNEKFDHILHFATPASATLNIENPLLMYNIIAEGTRRTLDFAKRAKVKSLLLASSGAAYGAQPPELTHIPESYLGAPDTSQVGSAYGEAKRMAELLGNLYSNTYDFEHKIARCFAFVGPHLDPNGTFAIGNFIRDALKSETIKVAGDGTPYRSYLYSDDLVYWLLRILVMGKKSEVYNVGSDQDMQISDLANRVAKIVNPNVSVEIAKQPIPGVGTSRYVPSIQKAKKELQLDIYTSLDVAISQTAQAYREKFNF